MKYEKYHIVKNTVGIFTLRIEENINEKYLKNINLKKILFLEKEDNFATDKRY